MEYSLLNTLTFAPRIKIKDYPTYPNKIKFYYVSDVSLKTHTFRTHFCTYIILNISAYPYKCRIYTTMLKLLSAITFKYILCKIPQNNAKDICHCKLNFVIFQKTQLLTVNFVFPFKPKFIDHILMLNIRRLAWMHLMKAQLSHPIDQPW